MFRGDQIYIQKIIERVKLLTVEEDFSSVRHSATLSNPREHVVMYTKSMKFLKEKEILSVLQRLVQIPSRNPPGEEMKCAEYVADKMRDWGFDVDLVPQPFHNRPQVVAMYRGTAGEPTLVLNGHLDVVPEGDVSKWKHPPFEGKIVDGSVYGRGSCDMKGGISAMMVAAKCLKYSGINLKGNLILQFAIGEETGEPGTKSLLANKNFCGDWGIVLEPTNLRVATAEKGVAWFNLKVRGRQAHASTPELGINALYKAIKLIGALREYNREISSRRHKLLGRAICTVTNIHGGLKENIIPESCELTVDRRFIPGETILAVENELNNLLSLLHNQDPQFLCRMKRMMIFEPAEIPVNSYIAEVLRGCAREITGVPAEPYGTFFSTDVRSFVNDAMIPAVAWGPGDPYRAHTTDENVEIEQVVKATRILILAITRLLA